MKFESFSPAIRETYEGKANNFRLYETQQFEKEKKSGGVHHSIDYAQAPKEGEKEKI